MRNFKKILITSTVISLISGLSALASPISGSSPYIRNHSITKNEWINMEKGPAEAVWLDENGNPATPPAQALEEDTKKQERKPKGPGEPLENAAQTQQTIQDETGLAEENAGERMIDPLKPMVALTFDDGPNPNVGNRIMDCLAQYDGKATFFVVGSRCAAYAAEMQRMVAEGHEIGNHTYQHRYLNKLSADQILYQIDKGSEAIAAACGVIPATVRLPGGNKNATVLANVHYPMIMWSIDTLDWKTRNAQKTIEKVLGNVKDGDIVLMHELYAQSGEAAVQIIPALVSQGYQLVTVSEMAQYRGVTLQAGQTYSYFR